MRTSIEHAGQVRTVAVSRVAAGRYHILVDDHPIEADVRRIGPGELSIRLADGSTHHVRVERGGTSEERSVTLGDVRVTTRINGRRAGRHTADGGAAGPQRLVAPMPGRITRVLVAPGQAVDARTPLVVVEAMKMENELSASRAGTVVAVNVSEGESVEAGRLLVTVE